MKIRADYDVGTLESKVEMEVNGALNSIQSLIGSLDTLNSNLTKVLNNTGISNLNKEISETKRNTDELAPVFNRLKDLQTELRKSGDYNLAKSVKEYSQELYKVQSSKADKEIEKVRNLIEKKLGSNFVDDFNKSLENTQNVNKFSSFINGFKSLFNIGAIYAIGKRVFNVVKDIAKENIDMVETNNLFEVSMGRVVDQYGNLDEEASKYYTKAINFQNQMNEKLATNKSELMKYQAMYYSMLKSQGIDLDSSYLMSESLTKAGYDIASLYNLTVEDAMDKLKSGLAGQVEPLRKIGIDISESSLQKVLNDVGIERSVQQLSYAEKEVARYIAIIEQGGQAQGDFARTMDNSANQIKIFKNQLAELKQVAGAFIMNVFGNILVYVNAIIMVIKEILKSFASLFGWELYTSGIENVGTSIDNVGTSLGNATGKAKEFKKQLMGFDEINNITLPTTSSGGSGGGTAGGIDSRLLDNLREWDNKMESISGKAQEIRDKMLEWLGFVRNDDGTWRLGEGYTNFEKIKDAVIAIGLGILGWKLGSVVASASELLAKLGLISSSISSLRAGVGLGLSIVGIYFLADGIKGIRNGEITGETLLKSLGGSLELGVGAGILTASVPVGLTLALIGIAITMKEIGDAYRDDSLFGAVLNNLGIIWNNNKYTKNIDISTQISILSFQVWFADETGLLDLLVKNIKNILRRVADFVENIPFIGSAIAKGIRSTLNIEWNETSDTIKYTTEEAMKDAEPWVKTNAEKLGRSTSQSYRSGLSNTENVVSETTKGLVSNATRNATATASSSGYNLGNTFGTSSNKGIANVSLNDGTQQMVNTAKRTVANNSLFTEGSNLAGTAKTGFFNNSDASSAGNNFVNTASRGIRNRNLTNDGYSLAEEAKSGFNSVDMESVGKQASQGLANGMDSGKWSITSAASSLGNWAIRTFKNIFDINSPSKVMADEVGKYIPLGIAEGIDNETDSVIQSAKKLSEGVMVNTKDILVDTNQYIDYGTINGNIQTQSAISINGSIADRIASASYNAFCRAMRDEGVKVDIEAKTEEGIIFKKVQTQANEYAIQTGENPFPVLV